MFSTLPNLRVAVAVTIALVALAGCSAGDKAARTVGFSAHDYTFEGIDGLTVGAGERVRFSMHNDGPADHEFEVFGPDGQAIGEISPVHAGQDGRRTLTFARPGTYMFVCGVSDHEARGMKGTLVVT